jgi:hypothetical protein
MDDMPVHARDGTYVVPVRRTCAEVRSGHFCLLASTALGIVDAYGGLVRSHQRFSRGPFCTLLFSFPRGRLTQSLYL